MGKSEFAEGGREALDRSVYNMWLGIIFMVVSKFVAALLPGTLAVFQSFTALRFFPTFVISAVSCRFILEMCID